MYHLKIYILTRDIGLDGGLVCHQTTPLLFCRLAAIQKKTLHDEKLIAGMEKQMQIARPTV